MKRPFGYFVHHQGQGHARRCAALLRALPADRPITVFCARDDIFPALPGTATIIRIPSLFEEAAPTPDGLRDWRTPPTMHCVPLGWPTITDAVATIIGWFRAARPALFLVDVSAELAQLARIASVPPVHVLQHGDRTDPGHMAAYESCVGLLAPYHPTLEPEGRPGWMRAMTHHAPGLGAPRALPDRSMARAALGIAADRRVILVLSGGGGSGAPLAPLTVGARALPDALWLAVGPVAREWHETEPGNLRLEGWTDAPERYLAAADLVVSGAGNGVTHAVLAAGKPHLVIPEWRYFDEQRAKARALARAGAAHALNGWPASPAAWREALDEASHIHSANQRALVLPDAAEGAARWLERLADSLWTPRALGCNEQRIPAE